MSENTEDFAWEDPGPETSTRRNTPWLERLSPAMEQPGQWARVKVAEDADKAAATVNNLRNHKLRTPEGRWEFTRRDEKVYARYLGEDDTPREDEAPSPPLPE